MNRQFSTSLLGLATACCLLTSFCFSQNAMQQQPAGNQAALQPDANGQVRVPVMNVNGAVAKGIAQLPKQPFPPLAPEQQKFVDQVLNVWEERTAQVQKYICQFKRWQYDPTMANPDFFSRASGELRFMEPDKASFVINKMETLAERNPPVYKEDPRNPFGEWWICDGEWIHVRDRNTKKEIRYQLPPQMQGAGIPNSPLPFLFGVKAAELKARYWIRDVSSNAPSGNNSVILEAWPKRADDAGNYSRVQIYLDRADILPSALVVFLPNWKPEAQFKEIFEFTDREIPTGNLWDSVKQNLFRQSFIPTKLPADWDIEEMPYVSPQQPPADSSGRTAQPPAAGQQRIR